MAVRKLVPAVAIIVGGLVWVLGGWFAGHQSEEAIPPSLGQDVESRNAADGWNDGLQRGYVRGDQDQPGALQQLTPARSANLARSPEESAPGQDAISPWEREAVPEARTQDASPAEDFLQEPVAEEPALSISGWVQDDAAEPVAGIQVAASARQLFGSNESGKSGVGQSRGTARTDSQGYFELTGLVDGEYAVNTLTTPEYKSATARLRAGVDSAVLVVKGNAPTRVQVYGTVSSRRGEPLAGVHVRAAGATGAASTGDDGGYSLDLRVGNRAQSYSVRFTKRGYRTESLKLQGTALNDGAEIPLNATLEPIENTARVDGTVTDPKGAAVRGARVRLSSRQSGLGYTTRSNDAGEFSFDEVAVGDDYHLWVRPRSDYEEYTEEGIAVGTAGVNLPVILEPLESGTLRGQLVGLDGASVPNFSLWLRTSSPSRQKNRLVTSDRSGQFSVADLPAGEVSFSTRSSPQFLVRGVQVSVGDQASVELPLDLGVLEPVGYVLDANGDPVAGAQVSLTWSLDGGEVQSRSKRSTVTGAAGSFLFTQVGPGLHLIAVEATGYRPTRVDHYVGSGEEIIVSLQADSS